MKWTRTSAHCGLPIVGGPASPLKYSSRLQGLCSTLILGFICPSGPSCIFERLTEEATIFCSRLHRHKQRLFAWSFEIPGHNYTHLTILMFQPNMIKCGPFHDIFVCDISSNMIKCCSMCCGEISKA